MKKLVKFGKVYAIIDLMIWAIVGMIDWLEYCGWMGQSSCRCIKTIDVINGYFETLRLKVKRIVEFYKP